MIGLPSRDAHHSHRSDTGQSQEPSSPQTRPSAGLPDLGQILAAMVSQNHLMAVNETLILIAIVALGYTIWSLRRFFRSLRRTIHINTAEGTLMTRTLPNLAFAGLFFLVLNQTFLPGFTGHFGLDEFFSHDAPGAQQTLFGGKVLAERKPVVYPDFDGLRSMSHSFSEIEDKFGTPDQAAEE